MSKKDAQWIMNALDLAASACENIKDTEGCEYCPLWTDCLDEASVLDVAYGMPLNAWKDFLSLADDAYRDSAADEADHADMMRKMEQEERMIDEYHGI